MYKAYRRSFWISWRRQLSLELTAFQWAIKLGAESVARLLIERGADTSKLFLEGDGTALHYATLHKQASLIQKLLDLGSDPDAHNDAGQRPLHCLMKQIWSRRYPRNLVPALHLLLLSGADSNAFDFEKRTPLQYALEQRHMHDADKTSDALSLLGTLVENGAHVNVAGLFKITPPHTAILRESLPEVIEFLLSNGASVNAADRRGRTPLHLTTSSAAGYTANQEHRYEICKILLKHGGNPFIRDSRDALRQISRIRGWIY